MQPEILRRSNILKHSRCNDIVFREMGQCAHRFKIKVPRFIEPTADERTYPILDAEVHPIVDTSDPRISGGAIPGPLKWYNDSLDSVSSLAQTFLTTSPLFNEAITVHDQVLSEMRLVTDGTRILKRINWARCHSGDDELEGFPERYTNSDLWDWNAGAESKALELIVHTITNLGLVFNLNVSKSTFHGALVLDDKFVEILV